MAQLPPKVPTLTPNWADFSKMEGLSINTHTHSHGPSWVDEFLDFSSSRRGSHRRSMSDSVAFLDAPMVEECRRNNNSSTMSIGGGGGGLLQADDFHRRHAGAGAGGEFERFDDDQLMSMFGGAPNVSCSNPSSPSDHNSINDDVEKAAGQVNPKSEPDEDDGGSCKSDGLYASAADNSGDKIADPKRIKRYINIINFTHSHTMHVIKKIK